MRRVFLNAPTAFLSACLLVGCWNFPAFADTPANPTAPTGLASKVPGSGKILPAGSWVASTQMDLHFQVQLASGNVTPQVELVAATSAFSGQPTGTGPVVTQSGDAFVHVANLVDGKAYRWQARVVDSTGNASPWVIFGATSASGAFAVDVTPPSRPHVRSSTNPNQNQWYNDSQVNLNWTSMDVSSGVKGFTYVLERQAHVIPPGGLTNQTHLRLSSLSDGVWILAIRAQDVAGNWSPTATYYLRLDRQTPRVTWLGPQKFAFNPYKGQTSIEFSVSKAANVHLGLYRVGSSKPIQTFVYQRLGPGAVTTLHWAGRDAHGHIVGKGYYFFSVVAIDHANNVGRFNFGGIQVEPQAPKKSPAGPMVFHGDGKQIVVSLSKETLYAYSGDTLVLQTYVTTGNPSLPTPIGTYTILAKFHPYQFISPWPKGSPYYYAPSTSTYAMLFRDGGYFLHDAPWRGAFGPGTNGQGQPGTNYGGTHGCINIPLGPTLFLWNWAPVGTRVSVVH